MLKHKKISCFFFFVLTLFWSVGANSAQFGDDEDEYTKFLTPNRSMRDDVPDTLQAGEGSQVSLRSLSGNQDQTLLEKLYAPTVSRVAVPESVRQVVSGVASLVPIFPTGQVFVPTAIIGLLSLGLTTNIIPDVGWESWALVAAVATPIAIAALISTYNGASQYFKQTSPDVIKTQESTFERDYPWFESGSRSYLTQFVQLAFWGGLYFALLMNTESRVSGWGDYRILGGIFGTLALIPIYFILVRATNDINKYTYRHYKKDEEKLKGACLDPIKATKEHIKDNGLTPEARELGIDLNVIEMPHSPNVRLNSDPLLLEEGQGRGGNSFAPSLDSDDLILSTQPSAISPLRTTTPLDELSKPKYQRVFEKMMAISHTVPPWIKGWNFWSTKISKYSSRVTQFLSIPAELLVSYALPYSLCTYLGVPDGVSISVGAIAAVAYGVALPFISIKENGLIWKEHEQILRLFKPQETCGYFGERIAPVIARCGTLLYFTFPVTDFIRNNLLDKAIGITNVPTQVLILIPFMAGIGLAAPAQFLDRTYTTLANWVATGGQVTIPTPFCDSNCSFKLFRLFCCSDSNDDRAHALEIVRRLQEMEDNTFRLNSRLTKVLAGQLGIRVPESENSRLLLNIETGGSNDSM